MQLERRSLPPGKRPALVLVDFSTGFTSPDCPLGGNFDAVVAQAARLLAAFREKDFPVCYTTVLYRDPAEAKVFRARVPALNLLAADGPWVAIDPRLAPQHGEPVFEKHWASGFFGTGLDVWLRAQGADAVVVTGLTTSGCVRATAVDALQHDFPVMVAREAVGDRDPPAHAANLHDLHAKYADVIGVDEVIALFAPRGAAV